MDFLRTFLKILLCFLLPSVVHAELTAPTSITNHYTFKELGWDEALTLNGYQPSATLYFPLAKNSKINTITLHLTLHFSKELVEGTKVDITFNQTLIRSIPIPTNVIGEATWDIALPLTQLSPAWQPLSFTATFKSNKDLCSPTVWVYVSPKSSITIDATRLPFDSPLNKLPYPFIDSSSLNPTPIQLLVAKNPHLQDIFSLLEVAFELGKQSDEKDINVSGGIVDDDSVSVANSNIILIGTHAQLVNQTTAPFKTFIEKQGLSAAREQDSGILLLAQSPFNPLMGLLVMSGVNHFALEKAIKTFSNSELIAITSGKLAFIKTPIPPTPIKTIGNSYQVSMKELGYDNKSVSGLGRHRVNFYVPLPNDRIPKLTSIRSLITSPVSDNQGLSLVTLLVNDNKQSSFRIKNEHTAWSVTVDPSFLKPGVNKIEYFVDLHYTDSAGIEHCTRTIFDEVWATIHAETSLQTSFSGDFPSALLNQLPVPFANELTVILPPRLSKDDIQMLSRLFFKLGQLFKPNPINLSFQSSNTVNESFVRSHNLILIGTLDSNPWLPYALNYLPLRLKDNSRYLKLSDKQVQILSKDTTGLLELMPSPWNERQALLLITGDNKDGLTQAVNSLVDDEIRRKLEGNIALINQDKTIVTLNSYENKYISPISRIQIYISTLAKNIFFYISTHLQVLIYLLVFIVPVMILIRSRKKK